MANNLRYPAEWEPQAATWLAFPHNPKNWYGERAVKIREFYLKLIRTITEFQPVNVIIPCQKFFSESEKSYLADRPFPANIIVIKNIAHKIQRIGPCTIFCIIVVMQIVKFKFFFSSFS